jgi:3-dehydroquinate synthase
MPDDLWISSTRRNYQVRFVDDVFRWFDGRPPDSAFTVCDSLVHELYRDRIQPVIPSSRLTLVEAREQNKTLTACHKLLETLVEHQFRRNQRLVALGGGIIQDVVGFTASVLYRGVEWVFMPTTLLAQADSCIGGKTSINLGDKKNLIGTFSPPSEVLISTTFLDSLSDEEIKSGIGEMLHFYLYADSPLALRLVENHAAVLRDRRQLVDYIHGSLEIKKRVIELDEFDTGERQKFNYGHTFGHALESLTDYAVKHGQAVTVGMDLANFLSSELGLMSRASYERLHDLLSVNFPVVSWEGCDWDRYLTLLSRDKKNLGSELRCVLARGPGALELHQLPLDERLRTLVRRYFLEEFAKSDS